MNERPDVEAVLKQLKGFQRDTAEYAFHRLYLDGESSHRFLVADEVGLGKTRVARGIVAKAIDHLWDQVERIDIIYICSNANIARQNINRLWPSRDGGRAIASRPTLLPLVLRNLDEQRSNIVGFTPSTAFEVTGGTGVVEERVFLYWLLQEAWKFGASKGPINLFQVGAGLERFRREIREFPTSGEDGGLPYDRSYSDQFLCALEASVEADRRSGRSDLRARFEKLSKCFAYSRVNIPAGERLERDAFIGDLRTLLARVCLASLQPDLVILDEFQRFRHLLDGESEAADLARDLFTYADEFSAVRTLLLSATPYKMYTLSHEVEEEDHYKDFLRTVRFLNGAQHHDADLPALLQSYRQELYALGHGGGAALEEVKRQIEEALRRVMARTERMRVAGAGDGMLREIPNDAVALRTGDVRAFAGLQRVAKELDQAEVVEYWKSAPYLFNYMETYKLKEALLESIKAGDTQQIREILASFPELLLRWEDIERYAEIDPGNATLRAFLDDLLAHRTWETLWLPPAAPYYALEGAFAAVAESSFTKRLVFSAWAVVPRVISTLASYEAERRIFQRFESEPLNTKESRERRNALLMFTRSDDRLTGMPVLGLLYPSFTLARSGDVLHLGQDVGTSQRLYEVSAAVERSLVPLVAAITRDAPKAGIEDERWYWAAPILLDLARDADATRAWFDQPDLADEWSGATENRSEESGRWGDHVDAARELVRGALQLGRPPADMNRVVALLAIAGPSITALRTFGRSMDAPDALTDVRIRNAAARTGWSFRSLFNQPEAMAVLRAGAEATPFWRRVLEYSAEGCLQAVLDEYAHLLRDFEGLFDVGGADLADALADAMRPVIELRTVNLRLDEISIENGSLARQDRRLRTRFALRFGKEEGEQEKDAVREDLVRSAFNSPFWPFALITTSIGQEGLDFHPYCHAIVHWNLPANPVDLEQREGRVHRFKGHAIRKNIAKRYAGTGLKEVTGDPWSHLFELAAAEADGTDRGLSPYWVFPIEGGAAIERHVPFLPLSRDGPHLENLRRSLAIYRMVFGQPRQDDLMAYLLERVAPEVIESHRDALRISLAPPRAFEAQRG